jgi:hypothetical protein
MQGSHGMPSEETTLPLAYQFTRECGQATKLIIHSALVIQYILLSALNINEGV